MSRIENQSYALALKDSLLEAVLTQICPNYIQENFKERRRKCLILRQNIGQWLERSRYGNLNVQTVWLAGKGFLLRQYYSSLDRVPIDEKVPFAQVMMTCWYKGSLAESACTQNYDINLIIVSARLRFNIILFDSTRSRRTVYQYWHYFDSSNTLLLTYDTSRNIYLAAHALLEKDLLEILEDASKEESILTEIATRQEYLNLQEELGKNLIREWQSQTSSQTIPKILRLLYFEQYAFPVPSEESWSEDLFRLKKKLATRMQKMELPLNNQACYYFYGLEEEDSLLEAPSID